jgi:hypothetical protein
LDTSENTQLAKNEIYGVYYDDEYSIVKVDWLK